MSLAYIITAFKQPSQFARLMDTLWHPDDHFAVHVDAKSPAAVHRDFALVAQGRANIQFIAPVPVVWGGLTSEPTCTTARVNPPAGTYVVRGRLDTKSSADAPLTLG